MDFQNYIRRILRMDFRKALFFAAWGAAGGGAGSIISEITQHQTTSFIKTVIGTGLWFGIIGGFIAISIIIGLTRYNRRKINMDNVFAGVFGFIAGALAGAIAQIIFSIGGSGEILRDICWGIAGGLLGLTLSYKITNLGHRRGFVGGLMGGILGGCLFIILSQTGSQVIGRLMGVGSIGFFIGLMIIFTDELLRKAWLEISYGSKEKRTVSLGAESVKIGSDSASCNIYVADVLPIAYIYRIEQGKVLCDDKASGQTLQVKPGDSRQIGKFTVVVQMFGGGTQAANSRVSAPTAQNQFTLGLSSKKVFPLNEGVRLSMKDIPGLKSKTSDGIVAEVVLNPTDRTIMGLKNHSQNIWNIVLASGEQMQVNVGQSIKLAIGTKINFGSEKGEIKG